MVYSIDNDCHSRCCQGEFQLRPEYESSRTDPALLILVSSFSPEDAVERMKAMMTKPKPGIDLRPLVVQLSPVDSSIDDISDGQMPTLDRTTSNLSITTNAVQQHTLTNTSKASALLDQDLVKYHPDAKAFTVRSLDQERVHAVHMGEFPKRMFRCSCPSTRQTCCHILAVKLFLGKCRV